MIQLVSLMTDMFSNILFVIAFIEIIERWVLKKEFENKIKIRYSFSWNQILEQFLGYKFTRFGIQVDDLLRDLLRYRTEYRTGDFIVL